MNGWFSSHNNVVSKLITEYKKVSYLGPSLKRRDQWVLYALYTDHTYVTFCASMTMYHHGADLVFTATSKRCPWNPWLKASRLNHWKTIWLADCQYGTSEVQVVKDLPVLYHPEKSCLPTIRQDSHRIGRGWRLREAYMAELKQRKAGGGQLGCHCLTATRRMGVAGMLKVDGQWWLMC